MFIRDMLKNNRATVSCELFPPKDEWNMERAEALVGATAAFNPDFISVTCGASGSNSKNTLAMAECIKQSGAVALAHLTCVCCSKDEVIGLISNLKEAGIKNILALRGDIPQGYALTGNSHFKYASELVDIIKNFGGFSIGAACYPEGHVSSANQREDLLHLKAKADAGCDFLTTQMFFDNNILYRFLYKIRELGINIPVLAGIMPVTNKKQISRIVELSGTALPSRFLSILDKFGDDQKAMEQAGIAYATEQIIDLLANGVHGIHIYTMNKPEIARAIMQNISFIIRQVRLCG
ncbi:MAG TPA: methylenetetrahydrofolate reductase [Clostridia bacterium]|nr:methylenetetrahydrofolate reductase [Clostridia bacterium]